MEGVYEFAQVLLPEGEGWRSSSSDYQGEGHGRDQHEAGLQGRQGNQAGLKRRLKAGAVNRDFWTCGSFADFVAALGERRSAYIVTGTAFCELRSADFLAGAALGEP